MKLSDQILSKSLPLKVGEVKLIDGKKAMCINTNAYFGGGQGPVWAVEGTRVQFCTHFHGAYMEGICVKVYPDCLSVAIELTKANTWGSYVTGTIMRFQAKALERFNLSTDETEFLGEFSRKQAADIFNKKAFRDISIKELQKAIESGFHLKVEKRIGAKHYQYIHNLIELYLRISKKVGANDVGGNRSQIDQLISRLHDRISDFNADTQTRKID